MDTQIPDKTWSVSEAKSRLSEILRCARKSGPQYIGKREQCVVISKEDWQAQMGLKESLSAWLVSHTPSTELELPGRGRSAARPNPFEER